MRTQGFLFLAGYILLLGVGTFLQKLSMKTLSPFQLNFLIALGMVITAVPILLVQQKNLSIPVKGLPLGAVVGVLFALGSFLFTLALSRLPAGTTTAISLSYLGIVVLLSVIFLHESVTLMKSLGMLLAVAGVAILALQSS